MLPLPLLLHPRLLLLLLLFLRLPQFIASQSTNPVPSPILGCSGSKSYTIQFSYNWSPDTDPGFPSQDNGVTPGFTPLICAAHNTNYSMWQFGETISPAVRGLLINLTNDDLTKQLTYQKNSVYQKISKSENSPPTEAISLVLSVNGTGSFTLLSCIAKIVPSPDWFVGFTSFQTCLGNNTFASEYKTTALFPYDGGIDDADTYTKSSPKPMAENEPVSQLLIEGAEGYGTLRISPLSKLASSPFSPTQKPTPSAVDTSIKPTVCIASHTLRHLHPHQLLYGNHQLASVLCDPHFNCATPGHIVYYQTHHMMMKSYCNRFTTCHPRVMYVNSPRYSRALRIPSNSSHLHFSAFAARHASIFEEFVLSVAIKLGL